MFVCCVNAFEFLVVKFCVLLYDLFFFVCLLCFPVCVCCVCLSVCEVFVIRVLCMCLCLCFFFRVVFAFCLWFIV